MRGPRVAADRPHARRGGRGPGRADWATTGGSTPAAIYRRLAAPPLRDAIPWGDVQLWWGDDRFVPRDHPLSNVHVATIDLLEIGASSGESGTGGLGADLAGGGLARPSTPATSTRSRRRRDRQERRAWWAAERYADELARRRARRTSTAGPAFDLMLLGVGPDGHILSVFPGSVGVRPAWSRRLPIPAPTHVEPHVAPGDAQPGGSSRRRRRSSSSSTARAKAAILGSVLGDEVDERRWPAQLARREGATWILDEAAASALRR